MHPIVDGPRPCRVVVLCRGGDAPSGASGDALAAVRVVLDTLSGTADGLRIDVCAPDALHITLEQALSDRHPELHLMPACADIGQALALLQPDEHAEVAWIEAGVHAPAGWHLALQQCLQADPAVGLVSPLAGDDPWWAPMSPTFAARHLQTLEPGPRREKMRELQTWLAVHVGTELFAVDVPVRACGVLRGAAAVQVARMAIAPRTAAAASSSTPLWHEALTRGGWAMALSPRVVVDRPHSPGERDATGAAGANADSAPGLLAPRELWRHAHPLTGLRHAVEHAWGSLGATNSSGAAHAPAVLEVERRRPAVRLHIAHSWGGGLSKWVGDFIRADQAQGSGRGLVLRSVGVMGAFGQRLSLYAGDEEVVPLRFWELGVPIHATATAHLEVRRILREIVEEFGVEQVIVSSLIGHSLDVLRTGLPTLIVAHDHHPYCVTLYADFEGECRSCDGARLAQCMARNPGHRFFPGVTAEQWLSLRAAFEAEVLGRHLPIAAPSPSVAQRWQSMMPALNPAQFRVIGHGLDLLPAPAFEPPPEGPLRVVLLGRLTPEKGLSLLQAMAPALLEFAELELVGCGEQVPAVLRHPRVRVHAHFHNPELPALLASIRPHVGLLMSTVPETFSYALSELWHAGIPVLGTASGALADRIEPGVSGFLCEPDPEALLSELRRLARQRDRLLEMRRGLLGRAPRTVAQMVREYERLLVRGVPVGGPAGPQEDSTHSTVSAGSTGSTGSTDGEHAAPATRGLGTPRSPAYMRVLQVNPQATWRQALAAFWQFTCFKASRSPKLPPGIRRWFEP